MTLHARHALAATALYATLWPTGGWSVLVLAGLLWALYLRARDDA